MEEEDLKKLREEREKELQEPEEEQRKQIKGLAREYLTGEARSRLANVRTARPEQASMIEAQIVKLGMSGAINGKLSDDRLKQMLKDLSQKDSDTNIKYR